MGFCTANCPYTNIYMWHLGLCRSGFFSDVSQRSLATSVYECTAAALVQRSDVRSPSVGKVLWRNTETISATRQTSVIHAICLAGCCFKLMFHRCDTEIETSALTRLISPPTDVTPHATSGVSRIRAAQFRSARFSAARVDELQAQTQSGV